MATTSQAGQAQGLEDLLEARQEAATMALLVSVAEIPELATSAGPAGL